MSRAVPVNVDGRQAIENLIDWHREKYKTIAPSRPLFPSRNGKGKQRMTRRAAHNVLKNAFIAADLNGHLATHSLRKSFAQRLYEQTGDIFTVQEMLGHKSIATTQKYLGVNYANVRNALEEMSLGAKFDKTPDAIQKFTDNQLLLELVRRGYDLTSTQGVDNITAEIVKIG